jgi:hypothetical protein
MATKRKTITVSAEVNTEVEVEIDINEYMEEIVEAMSDAGSFLLPETKGLVERAYYHARDQGPQPEFIREMFYQLIGRVLP